MSIILHYPRQSMCGEKFRQMRWIRRCGSDLGFFLCRAPYKKNPKTIRYKMHNDSFSRYFFRSFLADFRRFFQNVRKTCANTFLKKPQIALLHYAVKIGLAPV